MYPEWHGGIVLVAPNPLFRRVERRRLPADNQLPERTLVRLHLRSGASPKRLRLILWDERGDAVGRFVEMPLAVSWLVVEHPYPVAMEGLAIVCEKRGLLHWEAPAGYISQVRFRMAVRTAEKQVIVPPTSGQSEEQYRVKEMEDHEVFTEPVAIKADSLPRDISSRLSEMRQVRRQRSQVQGLNQKWFHGNQAEAAAFIRGLVGRAQKNVMIIDPYFAGRELIRFAHATTRPDVRIGILTSAMVLTRTKDAFDPTREAGEGLLAASRSFDRQRVRGQLEIRVMPGDTPQVHDRFLVVDSDVWLSGNSLNEIGQRAGMILRLPDPAPVVTQLRALFDNAKLLEEWLEGRRTRRKGPPPGSNGGSRKK
jgi:hypothetical protein